MIKRSLLNTLFAAFVLTVLTGTVQAGRPRNLVVDVGENFFTPSREVVTPHIPWAVPYAGGKLRVLFLAHQFSMREVVEFAQRLELDYTFWGAAVSSGNLGVPPYFRGGEVKGAEAGDRLKRLESLLTGLDYDLIVVSGFEWSSLPLVARYEILKRVKKGTGLVKIDPTMLSPVDPDDEYLKKVMSNTVPVPLSVVGGVPWQALPVFKDYTDTGHFVESTLKASRFGRGTIITLHGYKLPPRHLLCPGFTRDPLPSWWDSHWHEIPDAEKAEPDMPIDRIKRLHYDYYLAWLIKVMLFAAGNEPPVTVWGAAASQGMVHESPRERLTEFTFTVTLTDPLELTSLTAEFVLRDVDNRVLASSIRSGVDLKPGTNTLSFPLSNIPAGDYFADLWVRRAGRTLGFGTQELRFTSGTMIKAVKLTAGHFEVMDSITAEVEIEGAGDEMRALRLEIRQEDNRGRLVRESSFKVQNSTFDVALPPISDPLTVYQFLTIDLLSGKEILDRKRVAFTLSDLYLPDTIRVSAWQHALVSYYALNVYDQIYKLGFDSLCPTFQKNPYRDYFGLGPNSPFKSGMPELPVLHNLRSIPNCAKITDAGTSSFLTKTYLDGKPIKFRENERIPCLNDPRYNEMMKKRVTDVVEYHEGLSTSEYMFDQESAFVMFWTRQDNGEACYCPYCREYFRDYLKKEYGSIDAVNAEYGTDHEGFESIEPVQLADAAKDQKLWPLWADFRMAMDSVHSGFFERMTGVVQAIQPGARTGDDYTNSPGFRSLDAFDVWKFSKWQLMCEPKPNYFNELRADFSLPRKLTGLGIYWGGAIAHCREYTTFTPWELFFKGANFFNIYPGDLGSGDILAGDLAPRKYFRYLIEQCNEFKGGIGKLIHESERDHNGVAVLYSIASIHHWPLLVGEIPKGTEGTRGGIQAIHNAWIALLHDTVGPFRFVSYEQLADGILAKGGFRLLVLPWSQALSPEEVEKIKNFVRKGGTVLADVRPGVSDGHCKPYDTSPLDEVFGVVQNTRAPRISVSPVHIPFGGNADPDLFGKAEADLSLKLGGGKAAGTVGDGTPALVSHSYGKGKSVLLNFTLADYILRLKYERFPTKYAPRVLSLVAPLLRELGVQRPVGFSPELKGLRHYLFRSGNLSYLGLLQDLPETYEDYAGGTAKPLLTRRTTVTLMQKSHIYDIRERRYVGFSDKVTTYITPAAAKVFALMPYRVREVAVTAPVAVTQGDAVDYAVRVETGAKPGRHVLRIEVTGPSGTPLPYYAKNVACAGGQYRGKLRLALNEQPGTYHVLARDVASGLQAAAAVNVAKREVRP